MKHLTVIVITIALLFSGCDDTMDNGGDPNTVETDNLQSITDSFNSMESDPLVAEYRIIPGKSIGKMALGMNPYEVEKILGEPDLQDAAMGKAWLTWKGERDMHNNETELNIYITYKDSNMKEKVVQQIRVSSASFHTQDSIRVYASLEQIKAKFPALKAVRTYKADGRSFTVYDAIQQGIAFDIVAANGQHIATAISIHTPGVAVNETYIHLQNANEL